MGWFFNREKKKVVGGEKQPKELAVSETEKWFYSNYTTRLKNARERVDKTVSEILRINKEIGKTCERFEKEKHSQKELAKVNAIKDQALKKIKTSLVTSGPPGGAVDEWMAKVRKSLKAIKTISGKETIVMTHYFPKQTKELIEHVRKWEECINSFDGFLSGEGAVINIEIGLKQMLGGFDDTNSEAEQKRKEKEELKKRLETLEQECKELKQEKEELLSGSEWKEWSEQQIIIDDLKREADSIESEMKIAFNTARRPLEKINYNENSRTISLFMENPTEAFGKGLDNEFKQILNTTDLRSLKDNEREKLDGLLRQLPSLSRMKEKQRSLSEKIDELSNKSSVPTKKYVIDRKIEEKKRKIDATNSEISQLENLGKKLSADLDKKKAEIEVLLKGLGEEVVCKY